MKKFQLFSQQDTSINSIESLGNGQAVETRWVQRGDRGIVYLSSQTACAQGCRMCWLTATGQTKPTNLTPNSIIEQAQECLKLNTRNVHAVRRIHFNFMARGEFLANPLLTKADEAERLVRCLQMLTERPSRVLISTIMPKKYLGELTDLFKNVHPEIYYSLYTTGHEAHSEMFPSAVSPFVALAKLKRWQDHSAKIPKIHLALIKGFNDDFSDWQRIADAVHESGLRCDFNLVRYNPPNQDTQEASEQSYRMAARFFGAQVVNRVGTDVYASCGMFYKGESDE